jgi:hypothetical protein
MFSLFARKPAVDPTAMGRLKGWITALMGLTDAYTIMVAELRCRDKGCIGIENVVTNIRADRRRFVLRFPAPVAGIIESDVQSTGPKVPG